MINAVYVASNVVCLFSYLLVWGWICDFVPISANLNLGSWISNKLQILFCCGFVESVFGVNCDKCCKLWHQMVFAYSNYLLVWDWICSNVLVSLWLTIWINQGGEQMPCIFQLVYLDRFPIAAPITLLVSCFKLIGISRIWKI